MPSNLDNAKKAYELFLRGDIQTMLTEHVGDTARYVISGIKEKMPWSGTYEGKQHIAGFFQTLTQHVEFIGWENREWIEAGDTVILLGSNVARMRATGKEARGEFAHIMKYDANGKIVMFQEYTDTAKLLAALSWRALSERPSGLSTERLMVQGRKVCLRALNRALAPGHSNRRCCGMNGPRTR